MSWDQRWEDLMASWAETQRKMTAEWAVSGAEASERAAPDLTDWFARWREAAAKGVQAWTEGVGGVPGEVGRRLFGSGKTYMGFLDFFVNAMKDLGPKVGQGGDWEATVEQYVASLRDKAFADPRLWLDPAAAAALSSDTVELWKLYQEQARAFAQPWIGSLAEARGHVGEAMAGDRRAIIRTVNLFTDTYESTLGKFTGAPAIGFTREYQEKAAKAFDAWTDLKRAEAAYQTEVAGIGFRSLEAMVDALKEKGREGQKIESPRELFDLWVQVAEATYLEAAGTEAFAKCQGELVNAAMHYRIHERVMLEEVYKACHLPTRREVDDAYRHMYEAKKEVQALRGRVQGLEAHLERLLARIPEEAPVEAVSKPAAVKSGARSAAGASRGGPVPEAKTAKNAKPARSAPKRKKES